MDDSLLIIVSLGLAAVVLFVWWKSIVHHGRTLPPGPTSISVLKDTLKALKEGNLHHLAENWAKQYGDLVLCRTVIGDLCFLNSAHLVREVFDGEKTEHVTNDRPSTFVGSYVYYNYSDVAFGGPARSRHWHKLRKLLHSAIKFYGDGVERLKSALQAELAQLVQSLEARVEGSLSRDATGKTCQLEMHSFYSRSLQRILTAVLTGEAPEHDCELPALLGQFVEAADKGITPTTDSALRLFPFLRFLPGSYYRQLCGNLHTLRDALIRGLLDKAQATRVPGQPRGIVDVLLDEQKKADNDWLNDDNIRGILLNIVGGAYITSLETLKTLFFFLVHNPEVAANIQREIDHSIGQRQPELADRKNLPYTEAAILETLRLSSFVPLGAVHVATGDFTVNGMQIPKGSVLFQNLWVMNRDPSVWGDSETFRPERFLDDKGQLLSASHPTRQSFLPFGVGKRSCPGEHFARSRVFLYVTTLMQKFDFLPPTDRDLLPLTRDSWTDAAVLQLKPYQLTVRLRSY